MFEEKIAERILEWKKGKKVNPFEVQINPTNRCNLKCRFCWLRDFNTVQPNYEELSTRKYKEVIKNCDEMKVHTVEITGGGEPLMRKDILALMKLVKQYNFFGRLITNGTLFTRGLINKLIKIEWDEIIFSLDAPDKKINDYLRGRSFDRTVEAIKNFQLLKIKNNKEKPMINIHMVLCNKNFHLLPKMFDFAYDLNCRNLLIEPIVVLATKTEAGRELLFKKKDKKTLMKYIHEATQIAYKHKFQTNVDKVGFELINGSTSKMEKIFYGQKKENNPWLSLPCYQPFYRMIIRPWGVVGPCCMFDNIGDNVKEKSLKEIWFGEFFQKIREKMLKTNLPDFCSKCNPSQIQENKKIKSLVKEL